MTIHWRDGIDGEERSARQRIYDCTGKLRDAYRWRRAVVFCAGLMLVASGVNVVRLFSGDVRVWIVLSAVVPLLGFAALVYAFFNSRSDITYLSDRALQLQQELDSVLQRKESDS